MKNLLINLTISIITIMVTLFVVEGVARIYVKKIIKQEKLFEPDPVTGWKVKPELDLERMNSNGQLWRVQTDKQGIRGGMWNPEQPRVLLLGDSYVFGQGINLENRFDQVLKENGYSVLNLGVMGFGTDQQILGAGKYMEEMKKGDIVIFITCFNDFYDISRKRHSGRAKPWFELVDGQLQKHSPRITMNEILRDHSFLYAKFASLLASHSEPDPQDIARSAEIFVALMNEEADRLSRKGVGIMVVYHGLDNIPDERHAPYIEKALQTTCQHEVITCLNLDSYFNLGNNKEYFLNDGHWNVKGHALMGEILLDKLKAIDLDNE